jgi:hypothetical protein
MLSSVVIKKFDSVARAAELFKPESMHPHRSYVEMMMDQISFAIANEDSRSR